MILEDDRKSEIGPWDLIGGIDKFLSGWGLAKDGLSYALWACRPEHRNKVLSWVKKRGDIKHVKIYNTFPSGKGHCHIYVVREGHPALK